MTSKISKIAENENYTAISVGHFSQIKNHSLNIGGNESKGKVFVKDIAGLTGSELSFTSLPPKTELPFFHSHKQNEEIYIILKGQGEFQVDDDVFEVSEGSIVRVSTRGERSLYNSSDDELVYMVVQCKENSLEQYTMGDGKISKRSARWKK